MATGVVDSSALAEVARAIRKEDHRAVAAAATKCLAGGKVDPEVLEAKVVALLHEGKWAELLSTAGDAPAFALHRAYALYRSDRFDDALAALATATEDAREGEGALHLAAQVLYRSGRYGESAATYDRLLTALLADAGGDAAALDGPDADEDLRAALDDLRLNMAAAYVAAGRARELLAHPQFGRVMDALMRASAAAAAAATTGAAGGAGAGAKDPLAVASAGMAWELLYNLACALIDAGQASAAMRALCAAAARGKTDLAADGASDAEITNDLAIVRAQAGYLLQAGGYADAAAALYAEVLRCRPSDATVPAVAAINGAALAALSGGRELIDALRRLRATASSSSTVSKLLQRHVAALHHNAALLAGCLGQAAEARASADKAAAALETMRRSAAAAAAAAAAAGSKAGSSSSAAIDPHAHSLSLSLDVLVAALERVTPPSPLGGGVTMSEALAAVAAAPPAPLAAAAGAALPGGAVHPLTALRAASAVNSGAAEEGVALLLGGGAAGSAASASSALHPSAVTTCAHVLLTSGQAARAKELLASQAAAWGAAVAAAAAGSASKGGPAPASAAAAAGDAHASLTHALASLHMGEGSMDGAAALLDGLHSGASCGGALLAAEHRGAALAALSVVRTRQAAAPGVSEGDRSSLLAAADMCLREATALVVGAGGRKPSFVMDPARLADAELDVLENAAADPLASAAAAAAAARRAAAAAGGAGAAVGAGAGAAAPASSAASEEEAARAAARLAAAKRRRLARRSRRREAYVTALKGRSPEFARLGVLPAADPERWLPKRERTYGKKSRRRAIAKAAATVKTGGAQGAALNASVMASLDAKAKADAVKAAGGAGGAGAAGSPAKSSVTSPPPGAGKRKGGRR